MTDVPIDRDRCPPPGIVPKSPPSHPDPFAAWVRLVRWSHRLTQSELAEVCGANRMAVWTWESGRYRPQAAALLALADLARRADLPAAPPPGHHPVTLTARRPVSPRLPTPEPV